MVFVGFVYFYDVVVFRVIVLFILLLKILNVF